MAPADEKTSVDNQQKPQKPTLGTFILCFLAALCITGPIIGYIQWSTSLHHDPRFSVGLTEVHGLDPASSPVIHTDFHLKLRVDNNGVDRTCKQEITVTVFYGDMVVAWAEVPDFCVDKWSSKEVNVALSHAEVVLTDSLRALLASELRSGELFFGVEMRMRIPEGFDRECHDDYCVSRQSPSSCAVPVLGKAMYHVICSSRLESK